MTRTAACPVTPGGSYGGDGVLSTLLPDNGTIVGVGRETLSDRAALSRIVGDAVFGSVGADGSIRVKFPWWWHGPGRKPRLRITGSRLDRPAGPLRVDGRPGSGEPDFWASGIIFPTTGCWEVTGRAEGERLTFVVRVIEG